MKIGLALIGAMCMGSSAFAAGISGTYTVKEASGCDLQLDRVARIQADDQQINLGLYDDQLLSPPGWDTFFAAKMGDVITRPTPQIVQLGYTTTDRQIAGYDTGSEIFRFAEYLYDMSLTDSQGLATGFYKSVDMTKQLDGSVSYVKTYSDGEIYRCKLVPAPAKG